MCPKPLTYADLINRFWGSFLDSEVRSDGSVEGFQNWQRSATPWERKTADTFAHTAAMRILRDGRAPDDCIPSGVLALREQLANAPAEPRRYPNDHAYGIYRSKLIMRIFDERLTPMQVAQDLEAHSTEFPQIEYAECVRLRRDNDVWQPLPPTPPLSPERCAQIRSERSGINARPDPIRVAEPEAVTTPDFD